MPDYLYPTNAELTEIAQVNTPTLTMDDPIFDIMPIEERDTDIIMWEQQDDYRGLQQIRGINGAPPKVSKLGGNRYMMRPGVYGEYENIDELELTARRRYGTFGEPININDLVIRASDRLLARRIDRMRLTGWTLITTGTFSVLNADGTVMHTDTYPIQTYTAGVGWGTSATATPLANFRAVQLLSRGKGTDFGAQSRVYTNRTTFNNMISNTNTNDIAGRRTSGLNTVLNLSEINAVLAGEGLPMIVIYDRGYITDAGTWTPFIANNTAVVVGVRPAGQSIAKYLLTRNANNPGLAPGAYMKVVDDEDSVPRNIQVHNGHNGGPIIEFPGSIVRMNV